MPVFVDPVAAISPEFVCKLCRSPWDPTDALSCTQCEEIYCKGCVEDNAVKQRQCTCGLEFSVEKFRPAHRSVRNLADAKLLVKCKNFLRGCSWTGPRSELSNHQEGCAAKIAPKPVPVANVPEELVCVVCSEMLTAPVSLPCCEKLLCGECATESISRRPQCPMCNSRIAVDDLQKVPKQIESQLDGFVVRCPHHDTGCRFAGPRRNFSGHIAVCPFEQGLAASQEPIVKIMNDVPQVLRVTPENPSSELTTMIHIEAPTLHNLSDRKMPLRMCAVIDVSGSMKGQKLDLTKESLNFMVNELSVRDSFSLVAFDSTIERIMPMKVMTAENKDSTRALIGGLTDKNCTNLCGGLLEGLMCVREAQSDSVAECADALLLFTDGQANEGTTEPSAVIAELKKAMNGMRKAPAVYTFGFGADHNALLLQRIAESTQGSYYYVKDSSVLRDCFADCLGGLISIVMNDITVSYTLAPGVTQKCLMTKFPSTVNPLDGSVVISIKDMYSAEVRDIPVALALDTAAMMAASSTASSSSDTEVQPVQWKLSYVSALDQQQHSVPLHTRVIVSATPYTGLPDLYVDEQRNRFTMTIALEQAKKAAEERNFARASEVITKAVNSSTASPSANAPQLARMMQECEMIRSEMSESRYDRGGAQALSSCFDRHRAQRSNEASSDAMYQNAWKMTMKKK